MHPLDIFSFCIRPSSSANCGKLIPCNIQKEGYEADKMAGRLGNQPMLCVLETHLDFSVLNTFSFSDV